MKQIIPALFSAMLTLAPTANAQDTPVVVELYTSQGCSSCPPADAILHELANRDDVIALALHVDYWDYIGWKDPFGDPAHAERQRAYAATAHRRSIYTPEMIVGGVTDIVGAKPMKLSKAIAEHAKLPKDVALDLTRSGDSLQITATALGKVNGPLTVHMLRYTPSQTTQIKRGENRGKTLENANIVEGWAVLGAWDGNSPLQMNVPLTGDKPAVVILQEARVGRIVAAARLR
ncbi:DUF1223 domain-containing protein [Sulfitobacter sp. M57]|uniref:DUF1223 domain-containing protein n=1 Tax=unclassified Sulfitobacter TaxID=196795 RepID=UPI0023E29C19|nr:MULTISPECIES: DUF1223 domain-containing protein [unclassified Sulfitobacter]MDF3413348.1 DUF1223 domain-containing protein [Sulfitobacter sp. KE5]MDF3421372.1 DUF1223 domain-containing protein [Sulfitobacter sp. KE43]MDF3431895.1 DUF1223 domain-containing protein [Sulfitobacter sp. KE42]MDF3457535.1 DUF1223 domain-containing protein [Sulfitobacter sp. S74]MDF3461437.1 DUF1223 domain-containing protein [Sulfitobacter sp. Ks18]